MAGQCSQSRSQPSEGRTSRLHRAFVGRDEGGLPAQRQESHRGLRFEGSSGEGGR